MEWRVLILSIPCLLFAWSPPVGLMLSNSAFGDLDPATLLPRLVKAAADVVMNQ